MSRNYTGLIGNITGSNATANDGDLSSCHWPWPDPEWNKTLSHAPTRLIYISFTLLLAVMSTIGGLLIILVQVSQKTWSTTNIYLIVISASNIITGWLGSPENYDNLRSGLTASDPSTNITFKGISYFIINTTVWISDLTLVVFSIERLACTTNPFRYIHFFSARRALIAEAGIFVVSAGWNVHYAFHHIYLMTHNGAMTAQLWTWDEVMYPIDIIRVSVICVVITVADVTLIVLLKKQEKTHTSISGSQEDVNHDHTTHHANSTHLLMCSATVFLLSQFPYLLYAYFSVSSSHPFCSFFFSKIADAITSDFVFILWYVNYSVDFFVYYATSATFKRQFHCTLRHHWQRFTASKMGTLLTQRAVNSELTITSNSHTVLAKSTYAISRV